MAMTQQSEILHQKRKMLFDFLHVDIPKARVCPSLSKMSDFLFYSISDNIWHTIEFVDHNIDNCSV